MRICPNVDCHFISRKKAGALCSGVGAIVCLESSVALLVSDNGGITNTLSWKVCNYAAFVFGFILFYTGSYLRENFNRVVSLPITGTRDEENFRSSGSSRFELIESRPLGVLNHDQDIA